MRGNNSNKTVSKKQHPICLKFEEMYNLEKRLQETTKLTEWFLTECHNTKTKPITY